MNRSSLIIVAVLALAGFSQAGWGQENDPTAKSDIITKTLSKIRDVEKLDGFVEQNQLLKAENKQLKTELASIKKQLAKLTADFEQQNAKIRKQLLQTPTFQVLSKVISGSSSMALLKTSKTQLRVRANTKLSVPVSEGAWVLMEVREISKDMIVLYFPELERKCFYTISPLPRSVQDALLPIYDKDVKQPFDAIQAWASQWHLGTQFNCSRNRNSTRLGLVRT